MQSQSRDAKGFVDGVVRYVKTDGKNVALLPKVEKLFRRMTLSDKKQNTAHITSSHILTTKQKDSLKQTLESMVGHGLDIEYHAEEDLVAGMRIQIGDFVIDTTFANQLSRMGEMLIKQS